MADPADGTIRYPVELLRPQEYPQMTRADNTLAPRHHANPVVNDIASLILQLTQKHYDAVISRDFSQGSPIWQDKASWWKAEIGMLSDRTLSLNEYVEQWRELARQYPTYAFSFSGPTIADSATVEVNSRAGTAEIFVTGEIHGMPNGLTRSFVGALCWRKVDGRWMSTRFRTLPGGLE